MHACSVKPRWPRASASAHATLDWNAGSVSGPNAARRSPQATEPLRFHPPRPPRWPAPRRAPRNAAIQESNGPPETGAARARVEAAAG
jgi:hypothetical protein